MNLRPKSLKVFFAINKVAFARVECSENENISKHYELEGYPKMIMFHNGERIDYEGQRIKPHISNWLNKLLTDPLEPIDE